MDSLQKSIKLLTNLDANGLLVRKAQRIELKRTRSGHYRLWMGFPDGIPEDDLTPVKPLLEGEAITMNPFAKKGLVTAVTFLDDNEDE